MATEATSVEVEVAGHTIAVSNPDKVFFPERGERKIDLVMYYIEVADAVMRGVRDRPTVLRRFPDGAMGSSFFQKRVPERRPAWLETAEITFPSGGRADELCPADIAHIVWAVNLGCLELHPWPVRRDDLDHPDELRVDLDPQPGVPFDAVRSATRLVRERLEAHGLVGFPKTSGSRGIHVNVPIEPRWGFTDVRRAALALGREVERAAPDLVTTAWWKAERGDRVFFDYNQNARDRTIASAYSVRPTPDARVSCPIAWAELDDVEPADLTVATVPGRLAAVGDPGAGIDDARGMLDSLLRQADADEASGLGDAPWPPHTRKQPGEPRRAPPRRR